MDENKWRIHKDWRFGNRWVIFAPGNTVRAAYVGNSHGHCVSALPFVQRIDYNTRKLKGRRP